MAGLDTNVLVRWLLDDDARQSALVAALMADAISSNEALFVPTTVVLELEWVLRSRYQFDKLVVLKTFGALLETQGLSFENEALLEQALDFYKHGSADFADCLHAGACAAAGQAPLLTFDRGASKLNGVRLLKA
jgi:predicted nucleic-acid-binding protein